MSAAPEHDDTSSRPNGGRLPAGSDPEDHDPEAEYHPSPFPHPPWTVGLILVAGAITLLFGVLVSPIWLVVGSPFLVALVLWLYIRLVVRPDD